MRPTVLTIAGSDCSAGAGIQADVKTIEATGGYAASVLTAVTAQNTRGILRWIALDPELVRDQLEAVLSDLNVVAVKSGMLANEPVVGEVVETLRSYRPRHYVCDPVMRSASGCRLLEKQAVARLRRDLLPLASLVTPNVHEAEVLTGQNINDLADAERAALLLLEAGPSAVLITGGHLAGESATDVLATRDGCERFPGEWIHTRHTHGSGCTHSAAVATALARGLPLTEAVTEAKRFVTEALRHGLDVGQGNGPADPFFFLYHPVRSTRGVAAAGGPEGQR